MKGERRFQASAGFLHAAGALFASLILWGHIKAIVYHIRRFPR